VSARATTPPGDEHRPWPRPAGPWVMRQTWHDLLFAHWPVPAAKLRAALSPDPATGLALDTFDGAAWVGVVPFRMSGVRPRGLPPLPRLSAFPELNVRTYVTLGDRPGVWFFSLDAGNALAVRIARRWFHLPYFAARMACEGEGGGLRYASERAHAGAPPARFLARYAPAGAVAPSRPGTLEHWLTERYCLYAYDARAGRLLRGEIHHARWPLQPAEAEIEACAMTAGHGFELPDAAPLLHFARRLDVIVWSPYAVGAP
jgi:uncharacterized protein